VEDILLINSTKEEKMEKNKILSAHITVPKLTADDKIVKNFYSELECLPVDREHLFFWRYLSKDFENYSTPPLTRDKYMHSLERRQELDNRIFKLIHGALIDVLDLYDLDGESSRTSHLDYLRIGLGYDYRELRKTVEVKKREIGPLTCRVGYGASREEGIVSSSYPTIEKVMDMMCMMYVKKLDDVVNALKDLR
jgi:hypothetical protein